MMKESNYRFEFYCDSILLHLDSVGWYYVSDLQRLLLFIRKDELIKALLYLDEEMKFIERHDSQDKSSLEAGINYMVINILPKGHGFINTTSFLEESRKRDQEAVLREQAYKIGQQQIIINKWLIKSQCWPHILSAGSLIIAAISGWYAVRAYNLSVLSYSNSQTQIEQTVKIEELKKKLQETRHDTYKYHDSLEKTKPTLDTVNLPAPQVNY